MIQESSNNLTPWKPVPTPVPGEWLNLIDRLENESIGTPHQYVLRVKFNARAVGDLLVSWGLPLPVVLAGYLMEYDKKLLSAASLAGMVRVLNHIRGTFRYISYIEDGKLPPLLTPPYEDLGGLLVAVAIYYQALRTLQLQSEGHPTRQRISWRVERIGNSLLNIVKRLGMWYFKREVEDILEHLHNPEFFAEDRRDFENILQRDRSALESVRDTLATTYRQITGQEAVVLYTPCGVAGLKRRLQDAHTTATSQKGELNGFDLVIYDIIVPAVADCYAAFGALSQLGYIQDRVNDHIANPKNNGYSHIALGLVLNPASFNLHELNLPANRLQLCQLQIATRWMQAIGCYGCLFPDYYALYDGGNQDFHKTSATTNEQFWKSQSGNVFQAIQESLATSGARPEASAPIIVYDKNRQGTALPVNATVLDFAYALGNEIGELAVEAIVNNRKAPLYRALQTGDVVEIRTARQTQANTVWLDENYAITPRAKRGIKESIIKRAINRKGYELLREELRRYHYLLSALDLDEELRFLLKNAHLGSFQDLLERLENEKETVITPNWAAQES